MAATGTYPKSTVFVGQSWSALWRMARAMPVLWVTFIVASLAIWRIDIALTGPKIDLLGQTQFDLGLIAVSVLLALVGAVVTAAATMIVLRAFLLGEMRDRPVWQVRPGFARMAMWFVGAEALGQLVTMVAIASGLRASWLVLGTLAPGLVIAFFLAQYFQLSAALAVGLPSAGFDQARDDGRGLVWTYIGAMIMVLLRSVPVILVATLIASIGIGALQNHDGGFWQAARSAWEIAYSWANHSVEPVVVVILGARVQACLFADARAKA